ncbi:MAG: hypothetical protein HKO81_08565 [Flavobacteriaceae bacterium]|nr:hypothetical protein [Flavobacteriaceae bacterium]
MKSIITICSMLVITITATSFNTIENPDSLTLKCTELKPVDCSLEYHNTFVEDEPVKIEDINVYEVEEEVVFDFDTTQFLPKDFNALKGLGDLDWDAIVLVELEEEVVIDFDTKQYLPEDFNALIGMYDLDWSKIELIEIEEEVDIDINNNSYFTGNNDPLIGI